MTADDGSDARFREVLSCVAQAHRRERRASKEAEEARAAAEEIRAGPAYRIGSAVLAQLESRAGWVRAVLALRRSYAECRGENDRRAAAPADSRACGVVSFHGHTKISIPLTLEPQAVRVPGASGARELWATALSEHRAAQFSLQIATPAGSCDIQLIAERPHRLLTLDANASDLVIELTRTDGAFCVLVLELCAEDSRASELESEAADLRVPAAEHGDRRGGRELAPSVPFTAQELEQKLWGGFARDALPELERLKFDARAAAKERAAAAWYLTRWHYVAEDYARALANVDLARALPTPLTPRFSLVEAQCLMRLGRHHEAVEILRRQPDREQRPDYRLLESTAVRQAAIAQGQSDDEAETAQLAILNEVFARAGLAPIRKREPAERLSLANIECHASPSAVEQTQTVSVIVPAYNAEASIGWALDSLLAQTWRGLEVIVVDDCSSDRTAEIVAAIAEHDRRVRLLRLRENSGAYAARNAGVRQAQGELITVHDSDDWSHPQKLEIQVETLRAYASAVAVKSHWARVGDKLELAGTWLPRGEMLQLDFSSLLFHRKILDVLGTWDEALVGADDELYSRLRAVYGKDAVVRVPRNRLLALSLTREDSLTASKATHLKTLYYGLRWSYQDAYRWWHARLGQGQGLPFEASARERPFPVPLGNQPPATRRRQFDVIVIADFAASSATLESAMSYCVAAAQAAQRVAVFHWRHYALRTRVPLRSELYESCLRHGVDILSPGDSVSAEVVLVAAPAVLEHEIEPRPAIDANHIIVMVGRDAGSPGMAPFERYDPLTVKRHLREIFGTEGSWITWTLMVDTDTLTRVAPRWRGATRQVPVIGRCIVGDYDWPSTLAGLHEAYGAGRACETRFHGDCESFGTLLGELPANWRLVPSRSVDRVEFLRDLDFYLHYPHELRAGEPSRGLLEAMALGIPVVASPEYEDTLGGAVTCATPQEAIRVVGELWSSEHDYLGRAAAARAFVLERHTMADFSSRLDRIVNGVSAESALGGEDDMKSQCA